MNKIYTLLLLPIIFVACKETTTIQPKVDIEPEAMMVGGACSYKHSTKKVRIIALEEKRGKELCQSSVNIKYELTEKADNLPLTPRGEIKYNLSKEYLVNKGFDIGTIHTLKISTIESGTCSPVTEELVGLNVSDFRTWCQKK